MVVVESSNSKSNNIRQDPRFLRGKTCLKTERYEDAIEIFGSLLESMVENPSDPSVLAPVYHEYGHALLLSEETSGDVFGADLNKKQDEEEENKESPKDDLELAWEMLEMARVLYTEILNDNTNDTQGQLIHVYMRLGDLGMESGNFESSRADYQKALDMKLTLTGKEGSNTTSAIADIHCCMAMNCVYQSSIKETTSDDTAVAASSSSTKDDASQLLSKGLWHYVEAGKIMAAIVKEKASDSLKSIITSCNLPSSDSTSLSFTGDLNEIKKNIMVLSSGEKDILEFLEIYVELKEKADGVSEALKKSSTNTTAPAPVTQIGFSSNNIPAENKENDDDERTTVTVMQVRKKKRTNNTEEKDTNKKLKA